MFMDQFTNEHVGLGNVWVVLKFPISVVVTMHLLQIRLHFPWMEQWNRIWSHRIWGLPKQKLYGTWSERVSFSTKHNVDLVSKIGNKLLCCKSNFVEAPPLLNVFVAAKPRKIFWENFFKSKKKWEHFGLVKKKWEQSENIFGEAKKKSENIGETIWAGLPVRVKFYWSKYRTVRCGVVSWNWWQSRTGEDTQNVALQREV